MKTRIALSVVLVMALTLVIPAHAQAATFTVDTNLDSADLAYQACTPAPADCSLRGAIIAANGNGTADTIVLDPLLGPYLLTILGPDIPPVEERGDLDITEDLTIQGNGATVDAQFAADRVFHIDDVGGVAPIVTINNLMVSGGMTQLEGGGFHLQAGTLTLNGSLVELNQANNNGGGIYVGPGTTLVLNFTIVSQNTAGLSGGGLDIQGDATLNSSDILFNTAIQNGGGIHNVFGNLRLNSTTVRGNEVSSGDGGGIYSYQGNTRLDNSLVRENVATYGNGGGVAAYSGGNLIVRNQTVVEVNSATSGGGMEINSVTATLANCSLLNNEATSGNGGGVRIVSGNVMITNCKIGRNNANLGGGVSHEGGMTTIAQSIIRENGAASSGGGVFEISPDDPANLLTIVRTIITRNSAGNPPLGGSGGGIALGFGGPHINTTLVVDRSDISHNIAGNGGGIFNEHHHIVILRTNIFRNQAVFDGGGLKNLGGTSVLTDTAIYRNRASDQGGGIANFGAVDASGIVSVNNSTVGNNRAQNNGGAIFNDAPWGGGTAEVYLFSVTIAQNDTPGGTDGIAAASGIISSKNTIIGPHVTPGSDCAVTGGVIVNAGFSLEDGTSCGFALQVNPMLGALGNNGGLTPTFALLAGSPAIDAGDPAGCMADSNGDGITDYILLTDQRSSAVFPRVNGIACDIGAYEF